MGSPCPTAYRPALRNLSDQIKNTVSIRKRLESNRKDKDAKFRLILVESRIHRLARYYQTNWKYASNNASPTS